MCRKTPTDALLCADGPVKSLVDLALTAEHRRGHGALYDALNCGRIDTDRLRAQLALPVPRTDDGRIVLAVDVSPWLRADQRRPALLPCLRTREERLAVHPGWPYSFVVALEAGHTSWTGILDVVRLGPEDDATAVIADQLRLFFFFRPRTVSRTESPT